MAQIKDYSVFKQYDNQPCHICKTIGQPVRLTNSRNVVDDNMITLCRVHKAKLKRLGMNRFVQSYPEMSFILIRKNFHFSKESLRWENYEITGDEYE